MNIKSLLQWGAAELSETSESARLDAELLLGRVLEKDRIYLIAHDADEIDVGREYEFKKLIERRKEHEPVAYLIGVKEFWGLEFEVGPSVLIPRPATEFLIERSIQHLEHIHGEVTCLDLGTGSGCLVISLAKELKKQGRNFRCFATDISEEALEVAARNARNHNVETDIEFIRSDWFNEMPSVLAFHIIVTNPPYLEESDPLLYKGARFEPKEALFNSDAVKLLMRSCPERLHPEGLCLMEIGHSPLIAGLAHTEEEITTLSKTSLQGDVTSQTRLISKGGCYFLEIKPACCL